MSDKKNVRHNFLKGDAIRLLGVGLVFGSIKLISFFSVILLSNVTTSAAEYGLFEYALGIGILLAIVLNAGLQGAYPYFNLKLQSTGYKSLFYLHGVLVGLTILLLLGFNSIFQWQIPEKFLLAGMLGGIIAMQMMMSSILKSHDQIKKAVLLDAGVLLVLTVYILGLMLIGRQFSYELFNVALGIYLGGLVILFAGKAWQERADFSIAHYKTALNYGCHIVGSAFLVIFLTTGARILIEYFFGLETVGYYTFYLRFATLAVMAQQVFLVAFFRKIYQSEPAVLDNYFAAILSFIFVFVLLSWLLIPLIFGNHLDLLRESYIDYKSIYYMLCFHALLWTGIALNSNVIHREKLSSGMNVHFLWITLLMLLSIYVLHQLHQLDLIKLILVNIGALFLALEMQFNILKNKGNIHFIHFKWLARSFIGFFFITLW